MRSQWVSEVVIIYTDIYTQPFIKYSLPLVPCSWSIHGSRLAQRCNGLWGSSSANGLNGAQKHRGKIWQSKDSNGKPTRTQISMVTWTSQAHTTYSVCVYIHTYIYIYMIYMIYIYIYQTFSKDAVHLPFFWIWSGTSGRRTDQRLRVLWNVLPIRWVEVEVAQAHLARGPQGW